MPNTKMYCIMTAGHNIKRPEQGYATRIEVEFPNGLKFNAQPGEFFVSEAFHRQTTLRAEDESSVSDYGLITVNREMVAASPELDLFGCAFSARLRRFEMYERDCTVHGYKEGATLQTRNTSKLLLVLEDRLTYDIETAGGVSGGPVFISHENHGSDIVIGIHNYNKRATRLTYPVILEMLSWIKDYNLIRTFEVSDRRGVYLMATKGSESGIIARRGETELSGFKLVIVSAAKDRAPLNHHRFAIMPAQRQPSNAGEHFFLQVGDEGSAAVSAGSCPAHLSKAIFALNRKGKTKRFRLTSASPSAESLANCKTDRFTNGSVLFGCNLVCWVSDIRYLSFKSTPPSRFSLQPSYKRLIAKANPVAERYRILLAKIEALEERAAALEAGLKKETTDRVDSDDSLGERLKAEETNRLNEDRALAHKVQIEESNRISEDRAIRGEIQSAIAQEGQNRISGDNSVRSDLAASIESNIKSTYDSLKALIDKEAIKREADDGSVTEDFKSALEQEKAARKGALEQEKTDRNNALEQEKRNRESGEKSIRSELAVAINEQESSRKISVNSVRSEFERAVKEEQSSRESFARSIQQELDEEKSNRRDGDEDLKKECRERHR
ncbi:hypothetical protein Dda_7783 [Drechslerella dactyloides]|uniref:Uncharacterized protein n=1 Tax=Drechslerella dactyloides TaxID=74499 RepID=A0AAD6NFX9_DREDA|nr:hypothetical protein Dda_7783 [Drechslerella dactyloides]